MLMWCGIDKNVRESKNQKRCFLRINQLMSLKQSFARIIYQYLFELIIEMEENSPSEKAVTHWTRQEDTHYYFYLILKYPTHDPQKMRPSKLFKDMNRFIPTRSSAQCRTHHQKRFKPHANIQSLLAFFYRQNYIERLLDEKHLYVELSNFITKKYQEKIINAEEEDHLLKTMEEKYKKIPLMKEGYTDHQQGSSENSSSIEKEKPNQASPNKKKLIRKEEKQSKKEQPVEKPKPSQAMEVEQEEEIFYDNSNSSYDPKNWSDSKSR